MIPKPPKFPEGRTIKFSGLTFFGFKSTKLKHVFLITVYALSLVISFLATITLQDPKGIQTIWFVGNVFTLGFIMLLKGLLWLIKNWNIEL